MEFTAKEKEAIIRIREFEGKLPLGVFEQGGTFVLGWSWSDVQVHASILNNLVIKGCLLILFKSNSYTGYRLSELGVAIDIAELSNTIEKHYAPSLNIPDDIFSVIEGYDDIKGIFLRSLQGEPVDFLMIGVPGSSKTMFLSELERIGGATPTILGGTASKVGIVEILFDYRPTLLLLDEFEHMNTKDYTVLLSLCETRVISETKHGKQRRLELPNTRVFAGCNFTRALPMAILDRMQKVHFRSYTYDEFTKVVMNVLISRMGMEREISEYIGNKTWDFSHSVRQAIRIAKMAKTKEEVDELLKIIQKYSG